MALIGKFEDIKAFLAQNKNLHQLLLDIQESLNPDSTRYKEIINLERTLSPDNPRSEFSYMLESGIRAIPQSYFLKSEKDAFFEAHREFVDFQLCVKGSEYFLVGTQQDFKKHKEYEAMSDLQEYTCPILKNLHKMSFQLHTLGVFFPYDIHAGGLSDYDANSYMLASIQKVVYKVPIELFK